MAAAAAAVACAPAVVSSPSPISASSASSSSGTSQFAVRSHIGLGKAFETRLGAAGINLRQRRAGGVAGARSRASTRLSVTATPLVGNKAPDFEAEDQEFIKVKLSDCIGKKYVVLLFYPLDFTFVCPTEVTAFSDRYSEFEKEH